MTPGISVIIPTYNSARYLPQALDSVFAQNYPQVEIIVVDDGSTDETSQIIRPYRDRLLYLRQENAGSAAARNAGLAHAHGKYVVFLDADDWLLPGKLQQQVDILQSQPEVGLVHSGWQLVSETGNPLETVEPWHEVPTLDLDGWVWYKPVQMGAMLFRKAWLDRIAGFDPALRQSQDVDLIFRLTLAGMTAVWHYRPTFCYRIHPESTIRRQAQQHYQYMEHVLDKLFTHPDLPGRLIVSESKVRYYNLRWLAVHQYGAGLLEPMLTPLTEAARHSPHAPLETVIDWAFAFARERPFTDQMAREVWPLLVQATNLPDHEWRWLERLLTYWFQHDYPVGEEDIDLFLQKRPLWRDALTIEIETGLPAETFLLWLDRIWHYFVNYEEMIPRANFTPFLELNSNQIVQLAQQCIVYNPDAVNAELLDYFWQTTVHMGLLRKGDAPRFVKLHLTQFGQAALGRHWRKAGSSLGRAVLNTVRRPQAWCSWRDFVQTARAYQPTVRHLLIAWPDGDMPGLSEWAFQLGHAGFVVQVAAERGGQIQWNVLDEFVISQEQPLLLFAPNAQTVLEHQLDQLHVPLLIGDAGWELILLRKPEMLMNLLKTATSVLVQTPRTQEMAISVGTPSDKVHLIPPGVDTSFFTPLETMSIQNHEDRPFTLLSACDVNWQTDIETALLAVRNLCDAGVSIQFWLGGVDGYLEKEWVLFTIDDLNLQDVVQVNGRWPLARRRQLMQQADVYLDLNGTTQVMTETLEALACGLPVTIHAHSGAHHWLGASAIQFDHHDVAGLTDILCRLVQQTAAERAAFAKQARRAVRPLDWSKTIRPFKELYDRCLDR